MGRAPRAIVVALLAWGCSAGPGDAAGGGADITHPDSGDTNGGDADIEHPDSDGTDDALDASRDDASASASDGGDTAASDGANITHPDSDTDGADITHPDSDTDGADITHPDSDVEGADITHPDGGDGEPLRFVAVTFNTGSGGNPRSDEPNEGFGPEQSDVSDEWYGNGLAWIPFVEQTREWFAELEPDVVVFQEIFWPGECDEIPSEAHTGFVCETWREGDPTVVEMVLPDGWQIMCHPGSEDKCAAVRRSFGSFRGCDDDLCLDGMEGPRIDGCSNGARVAAATIDLADGSGSLRLVNFHGTSGVDPGDSACRVAQVEAVFVDGGDGEPLVGPAPNLVMGDLNTDPGRLTASQPSAARWWDFAGEGRPFDFVTDVGPDAEPTYLFFNIDHVLSDTLTGDCWHAGVSEGHPPVLDAVHFDHVPAVCQLELRR